MPIAAILSAINMAMTYLPTAISAGKSVVDVIEKVKNITSKDPNAITQQDLDDLQAENDRLRAEVEELEKPRG